MKILGVHVEVNSVLALTLAVVCNLCKTSAVTSNHEGVYTALHHTIRLTVGFKVVRGECLGSEQLTVQRVNYSLPEQ